MARNTSKWTQVVTGSGASITLAAGGKKATMIAGVGERAYLQRILSVNPGDIVEVVCFAQNVSGSPRIILDYPAAGTSVQIVVIDGVEFSEVRAAWMVPRGAPSTAKVAVNVGVFTAEAGEVIVYDPQITVNGFDIDANVIVESGSNVIGSFVKFADGTMFCEKSITVVDCTTPWGSVFTSGLVGVGAMPQTFVGDFEVFLSNEGAGGLSAWVYQAGRGTLTSLGVVRGTSAPGTFIVHVLAVGRWL